VATRPIHSGKLHPIPRGHSLNAPAFSASGPAPLLSATAETPRQFHPCGAPRILLADHHLVFLEGLHVLLAARGIEVVGRATNGADAVRLTRDSQPDVVVLETALPVLNGVDAARKIVDSIPGIGIILLSDVMGEQVVLDALKAGVRGFVVKTQDADTLVHAIGEVSRGGMYVSAGPSRILIAACLNGTRRSDTLSTREREVLRLVAEGKTTKEAAALLSVSVRTIDAHRASIMRTLGIHDTPGLVRYALRQGMIAP
jgi:two-component system response regulator NreC